VKRKMNLKGRQGIKGLQGVFFIVGSPLVPKGPEGDTLENSQSSTREERDKKCNKERAHEKTSVHHKNRISGKN